MTLEKILEAVIEVTGVPIEEMKIYKGTERATNAKNLYYEIARRVGYSYREIGELIDREHSSVMTSLKNHFFTPEFRVQLDEALTMLKMKGEPDAEPESLWSENFKVIDISSRYFGSCFMGVDNEEIVSHGCSPKVINEMLDRRS